MDSLTSVCLICIGILWTCGILCVCWCWSFYELKNYPAIAARRPKSSLFAGVLLTIALIIIFPTILIMRGATIVPDIPYSRVVLAVFGYLTTIGVYHVFTFRAYMVYFDIKFNKALEDTQWRLFIDPLEKNWFLIHRNTFGNGRKIALFLTFHCFVWITISSVIKIINGGTPHPMDSAALSMGAIIPVIGDIILYIKFPKFNDIFGVRDEMIDLIRIELATIIVYYIVRTLLRPTPYSFSNILFIFMGASIGFIYNFVILYRILKKAKLPTNPCAAKQYNNSMENERFIVHSEQETKTSETKDVICLRDILQDNDGFVEFARHSTREFCVENLLFFVETQQWMLSLLSKNEYSEYIEHVNQILSIRFPSSAPKSTIMNNMNNEQIMINDENCNELNLPTSHEYSQCIELFSKYITNSSYFCINICSKARNTLYDTLGYNDNYSSSMTLSEKEKMVKYLQTKKLSRKELFCLFEVSRMQVFELLDQVFVRFKHSEQYRKLNEKELNDAIVCSDED